jgi:mono/diheme cytochrome c family protein
MKLVALTLFCISITLISLACTESVAPTNSPAPVGGAPAYGSPAAPADATAKVNYAKNCESCHGANGEGGVVKIEDKDVKIPSLKSDHAMKRTDERMIKIISEGDEEMPPFKDKMTPAEITDLVKFVRKEFQGK